MAEIILSKISCHQMAAGDTTALSTLTCQSVTDTTRCHTSSSQLRRFALKAFEYDFSLRLAAFDQRMRLA